MYRRILVSIDNSPAATAALHEAARLAHLANASLRIVHLVAEMRVALGFECYGHYSEEIQRSLKETGEKLLGQAADRAISLGCQAQTVLIESFATSVSDAVLDQDDAWRPDVIVMGAPSRSGLARRLFGSESDRIVRQAKAPVMLVQCRVRENRDGRRRLRWPAAGHSLALEAE